MVTVIAQEVLDLAMLVFCLFDDTEEWQTQEQITNTTDGQWDYCVTFTACRQIGLPDQPLMQILKFEFRNGETYIFCRTEKIVLEDGIGWQITASAPTEDMQLILQEFYQLIISSAE